MPPIPQAPVEPDPGSNEHESHTVILSALPNLRTPTEALLVRDLAARIPPSARPDDAVVAELVAVIGSIPRWPGVPAYVFPMLCECSAGVERIRSLVEVAVSRSLEI